MSALLQVSSYEKTDLATGPKWLIVVRAPHDDDPHGWCSHIVGETDDADNAASLTRELRAKPGQARELWNGEACCHAEVPA